MIKECKYRMQQTIKCSLAKRAMFVVCFAFCLVAAQAQSNKITGTVTDQTGEPLVGVNIKIKNTTTGSVTDSNGKYSIGVAKGKTLIFSYIGFLNKEVTVNKAVINIVLQEDNQTLQEVVVVGYGQMKRTDLTGSVVSVSNEAIKKSTPTSVDQVLQGRAAGVQVSQNSGLPGGSSSIRIRGINSLNGSNEPIFVIDGVVIDGSTGSSSSNALSSINPQDIESMDILKDASATAIYGSRGSNGVIIITTKRGKAGESRVTYDGYVGIQTMPKKLNLLNLQEYAYYKNEKNTILGYPMNNNFIRPDLLGSGTDWQSELFNKAAMYNQNISVTGGNEKISYAMGIGYLNQAGIALGSGFDRLTLRGNVDSHVKSWLKVGFSFLVSNSNQNVTVADNDLINIALQQTPDVAARNPDGSYGGPETSEFVQSNPVGLALLKENTNRKASVMSNVYGEFTFMKGLTLRTEFGSNFGMNNTYKFTPSYTFGAIANTLVESERSKSFNTFWSWKNILTFDRTIHKVHAIKAMLGTEMQDSKWENLMGYRNGFITNNAHDLDAGDIASARNSGNSGEAAIESVFGRLFYSYNDRYLLTTTLRRDGSSKFAPGNQWGWFPSAALAWKVSSEEFLKNNKTISNLKFRLGWGEVGNQNIPNYAYTSTLSSVGTIWGTGLLSENTANPNLKWETTTSTNLGIDLGLFKNRIELIADIYNKQTNNLLLLLPLPAYVGTKTSDYDPGGSSAPWVNIGSLQNRGFELTLNTYNINRKNFSWKTSFVLSSNRNKVLSLQTQSSVLDKTMQRGSEVSIITRTAVGHSIGEFYGYQVIGRFNSASDFYYKDASGAVKQRALPEGVPISENGIWVGDLMYKDVNHDGKITEADRDYIGNPSPKFTYGIGNTFDYKNLDLTIFLSGSYGNQVFNWLRRFSDDPRANSNVTQRAYQFARLGLIDPNGPSNDFRNVQIIGGASDMPRLSPSSASANNRVSDFFVEDGSFLRVQNISLGYTIPPIYVKKIHLNSCKLYMNIQNLYTFSKYKGYDPELGSIGQNALLSGIDDGRYPTPRVFTLGLNVSF